MEELFVTLPIENLFKSVISSLRFCYFQCVSLTLLWLDLFCILNLFDAIVKVYIFLSPLEDFFSLLLEKDGNGRERQAGRQAVRQTDISVREKH